MKIFVKRTGILTLHWFFLTLGQCDKGETAPCAFETECGEPEIKLICKLPPNASESESFSVYKIDKRQNTLLIDYVREGTTYTSTRAGYRVTFSPVAVTVWITNASKNDKRTYECDMPHRNFKSSCYLTENQMVLSTGDFHLAATRRISQHMGRVEVKIMKTWTAMCGNNFSRSDAKVICRQLAYPTRAAVRLSRSPFAQRQDKAVLLVDYSCTGNESTLLDCPHKVHGYSNHCYAEEFSVLCKGTSVTLKCESTRFDQTAANYTWPETAGGRESKEYLTFDNVSRAHHGHRVRCMASYNHRDNTELFASKSLVMQVYYNPVVRVTSDVDSCQPQTTDLNLCVVTQNENVTLVCEADSNTPPISTTWSGKISSTGQNLRIISANPMTHDGLYTCIVHNTPADIDGRLKFVSSYRFSVIVEYPPTELTFRVNGEDNRTVTVAENTEDVDLVCQARGRPSPRIRVVNNTDDQLLGAERQGDIQSTNTMGEVFLPIRKIQCEASGDYTCTTANGLGRASQIITLLVLCAPKKGHVESQLPVLTFGESRQQLNVEMIAYPAPFIKSASYQRFHKNGSEGSASVEDRIHAVCTARSSASASITCTVSVVNVTEADEGVHQIVFTNGLGDLPFNFTVRRPGHQQCL